MTNTTNNDGTLFVRVWYLDLLDIGYDYLLLTRLPTTSSLSPLLYMHPPIISIIEDLIPDLHPDLRNINTNISPPPSLYGSRQRSAPTQHQNQTLERRLESTMVPHLPLPIFN